MNLTFPTCMIALFVALDAAAADRVSLNDATVDQLASIDGVDRVSAERVVSLRARRKGLSNVEELRAIPGLDLSTLTALQRGTSVEMELPVGPAREYTSAEEVLAEFVREPSIQQVQTWTSQYARTHPDMVRRLDSASRSFAALPRVWVEYRMNNGWDTDWTYYPSDGLVDSPDDQSRVFDVLDEAGRDQDQRVVVRLSWDLSELVMSSDRIRVVNETQDLVKLRDNMLSEATRLYFDRRRHQVQMLLSPARDLEGQVEDQLRLLELTAGIDALTGGSFSGSLPK